MQLHDECAVGLFHRKQWPHLILGISVIYFTCNSLSGQIWAAFDINHLLDGGFLNNAILGFFFFLVYLIWIIALYDIFDSCHFIIGASMYYLVFCLSFFLLVASAAFLVSFLFSIFICLFIYLFLQKYMPDLASLFSHVLVDVSSIKALCIRWYPRGKNLISIWILNFSFVVVSKACWLCFLLSMCLLFLSNSNS